jgi:hypothetical protein
MSALFPPELVPREGSSTGKIIEEFFFSSYCWGITLPRKGWRPAELSAVAPLWESIGKPVIIIPGTPDFLSRLVALSNCMRLSLKKAAHAAPSGAA